MMTPNFLVVALAALIPLVVGFIWYNKATFGMAWMTSARLKEEELKGGNMIVTFVVCYIFSFMICMMLYPFVIHQFNLQSILMNDLKDPASQAHADLSGFMEKYGDRFRTFKHGALHGTMSAIFIGLPIIGTSALFEKRGFKYIAVVTGYWIITLALMGGVICQWG